MISHSIACGLFQDRVLCALCTGESDVCLYSNVLSTADALTGTDVASTVSELQLVDDAMQSFAQAHLKGCKADA